MGSTFLHTHARFPIPKAKIVAYYFFQTFLFYQICNTFHTKVRGDGNKIGPAILLKVMAGDKFNIRANAWWTGTSSGSNTSLLTSVNLFLTNDQPTVSGKPKAYLNWILFDEQFKYVGNGNSGAEAVDGSGVFKTFDKQHMPVNKNGYLYIYTSNETSYDVFFDNLQVTHIRGPLLEESHYYPFGLTMAGISSKALTFGEPNNKYKYNGIEKEGDLGLEVYDAQLRELDGQTGRWWQIDPKTENMEMWSPYASNYDNPIRYSDPLGDEGQACCQWLKDAGNWIADKGMQAVVWVNNNINPVTPLAELATGKSLNSGFTENKPRSESATQAALFFVPTAKAEAIVLNEVKNLVVVQVEKQTIKKIDQEALKRGVANEGKVLTEEGLKKNTTPIKVKDPKTGKDVTTIPDARTSTGATVEVKDVKTLSDSKQLRAQSVISEQSGQKATVITGTNTKVSSTVDKRMNVVRKDNIGPQN